MPSLHTLIGKQLLLTFKPLFVRLQVASKKNPLSRRARRERRKLMAVVPQKNDGSTSQEVARLSVTRQSYSFSGPLPPPEVMGLYEQLIPGAAERLLTAFENQQNHRHSLENRVVDAGVRRSWAGLWCALAVALAGIAVAGLAVIYAQQWAASVIGGGTLVGLVTVFVTGRSQQEKERTTRRNAIIGDEKK